jgi:metallopeptidase family M12-like protein/PA14 domain-containing protein/Big-like domain-containing protein
VKSRLTKTIMTIVASALAGTAWGADQTATQILDHNTLGGIAMGERTLLQDFPLADAGRFTLDVERFTVLAPGARIVEQDGDQVRDLPDTNLVLLRGTIVGEDENSSVYIAVGQWGVNGVITRGDEFFSISSGPYTPEPGDEVIVTSNWDLDYIDQSFCQVDPDDPKYNPPVNVRDIDDQPLFDNSQRGTGCNLAPIAIDTDYEFTNNRFGGNTSAAADYAQTLMGASSSIYERDVNVTLSIAFLRTWASNTDPYSGGLGDFLDQVRAEWRTNMGGVSRTIVHGMSGRNLGGGVAYLNALCSNFWGYGVSALNGFFPNPPQDHNSQNWDIIVVPHEMGHNFGAPHTHDYNPVIDGCGNGDCSAAFGGTIMSYCHLCSGGIRNIVLAFHSRVQTTIENVINNAACITSTGNDFVAVDDAATTITGLALTIDALDNDAALSCGIPIFQSVQSPSDNGATVTIESGSPYETLRYTPASGYAGDDTFIYTLVGGATATVTVSVEGLRPADNPSNAQPGAQVDYYLLASPVILPDFDTLTPITSDIVPNIDYPATNGFFATSPLGNNVGAVFNGYVSVLFPGLYTFETESDDGSRLWIGDTLVVDNDGIHGMETQSGIIGLMGGKHRIRVEFFEATGTAGLIVRNSLSTQSPTVIPPSNWFWSDEVACVADWNGDGILDFFDVSAYLGAFSGGDMAADLNGDGVLDFFDISDFLSAFSAGCP